MKLRAYKCPNCRTLVFSRARHDYRSCPCGEIAVDGGFDYSRLTFKETPPIPYEVKIKQSKTMCFNDWNQTDEKEWEYGWIKPEDPEYPEAAKENFEF